MSILTLIEQTNFSPSEQQAIEHILALGWHVQDYTLKQLAQESYTVPATYVRLAKKLKYDGWNEFKEAFVKEIKYQQAHPLDFDLNIPFDNTDSILSIASKVTQLKITALEDTLELIDYKTFTQAVDLLHQARNIRIFASSVNLLLAQEFQFKMNRMKKSVNISQLEGEHLYDILAMNQQDIALVISYSGSSEKMAEITELLKQRQIKMIAITSLTENILTRDADAVLYMATREKLYSKIGQYSTNTSILHLLDLIYSALFAKNFQENLLYTIESAQIANFRKATARVMQEENQQKKPNI